jgi:phosphonatase-like hydrolase
VRARLAVFDMVGTTVHAGNEVPSSFRAAFRGVGIELSEAAIAGIRGRSKRDAISDLLSRHLPVPSEAAEHVEAVYTQFQEALRAAYRERARAIPGAEDVLRFLRERGVEVVLNTGLDRDTTLLLLRSLGWESLPLSGVVTGDDVSRGRPAPDLIYAAMRHTGIDDRGSVVAVGDTTSDLEAAAAAGVGWSIGVLSGAHTRTELEARPHSAILESVGELPSWLEAVGAL